MSSSETCTAGSSSEYTYESSDSSEIIIYEKPRQGITRNIPVALIPLDNPESRTGNVMTTQELRIVINPETGRPCKYGGKVHRKLVTRGIIVDNTIKPRKVGRPITQFKESKLLKKEISNPKIIIQK